MMWRRVLAVVVVGLLVMGPFAGALAEKGPIMGKGNPCLWGDPGLWGDPDFGDPDWPAFSRMFDGSRRVSVQFRDIPVSGGGTSITATVARPADPVKRESRWSALLFELRILGHTITIWRR